MPVEPTEAMILAARMEPYQFSLGAKFRAVWSAMLAAVPEAPGSQGAGEAHVVALALSKASAGMTTYSMSLSWKIGGTEQEAIDAAVLYAAKEKPGFGIWEKLTAVISLPPAPTHLALNEQEGG